MSVTKNFKYLAVLRSCKPFLLRAAAGPSSSKKMFEGNGGYVLLAWTNCGKTNS